MFEVKESYHPSAFCRLPSAFDGDGWIENGTNASPDLLHQFLQMQDRLEKQAREHQNSEQGRQQVTR